MNLPKEEFNPEEWKILYFAACVVYETMGDALTWITPSEFKVQTINEVYHKALIYARANGDSKIIENVQKKVDNWTHIEQNSGGGCITVIIFAVIGTLIGGPFGTAVGIWVGINISKSK